MIRKICMTLVCFTVLGAIPALAQQSGWLGLTIEDQRDSGAVVRSVERNSPAEKAGLKDGDVILEYNNEKVIGAQQLSRLIRETPVGRTADVKVRRDGRDQTMQVTPEGSRLNDRLGNLRLNLPDVNVLTDQVRRNIPRFELSTTFVESGIRAESLTDQLRTFFGVRSGEGVLVSSVEAGSAAAKAGLKSGDVITAINGRTVTTPSDFSREMRDARGTVTMKIVRDKLERELKLD